MGETPGLQARLEPPDLLVWPTRPFWPAVALVVLYDTGAWEALPPLNFDRCQSPDVIMTSDE